MGQAVDAAESAGIDFSIYDNDNDGYVDGIILVHAGQGAEEGALKIIFGVIALHWAAVIIELMIIRSLMITWQIQRGAYFLIMGWGMVL